ncbi:MAG: hypothetical protein Faunusvirus4_12 [Faunusvirus sp.]|jgi:hypothetical protein|uniref:Uncharacterized protein n=1 Tax=Faunusvirus sp. TaxID=2487766 RepID=A0A3G4ZYT9_9VIRU|nr:MAG: hypothetical protein Faunusvirus4_12 [Faunusvirus sp.]
MEFDKFVRNRNLDNALYYTSTAKNIIIVPHYSLDDASLSDLDKHYLQHNIFYNSSGNLFYQLFIISYNANSVGFVMMARNCDGSVVEIKQDSTGLTTRSAKGITKYTETTAANTSYNINNIMFQPIYTDRIMTFCGQINSDLKLDFTSLNSYILVVNNKINIDYYSNCVVYVIDATDSLTHVLTCNSYNITNSITDNILNFTGVSAVAYKTTIGTNVGDIVIYTCVNPSDSYATVNTVDINLVDPTQHVDLMDIINTKQLMNPIGIKNSGLT